MLARLARIRTWIFDLDNTLYPSSARLFDHVDRRMGAYISERLSVDLVEARRLQKRWFHDHGTTLSGMMAEHDTDPHEFLAFVHDIEMDALRTDAPLAAAIARLPGRKLVFTNADTGYAARVLDRLGLGTSFEAIHDIHAMALVPKPAPSAYAGLCRTFAIEPTEALFVEDMARNLQPAKAIGMITVWVDNGSEQTPDTDRSYIDFTTPDITAWLEQVLEAA